MPETDPASARRLAAVLSADVAGYVRLMRADEQGTHRRLAACMARVLGPLVVGHGGRVAADTGDGAIAEFPSASMAVRCALAVQRGVAALMADEPAEGRLAFRIGVALGEVWAKPGGGIYGDVVNLAVRLQGEADPGGICVSGAVCEQACGALAGTARFAAIGARALKHVADPVAAWRVWPSVSGGDATSDAAPTPTPAWEGPAVAVLPIEVLGDAAEDRWLADGLADDLIAALGAWGWFPVIARQSSFSYRGTPTPAQRIARELGAGYLVEGTFRRAAGRVRVNVRLVDGGSGRQLWAGGCERPAGHLFELQGELLLGIAGQLEAELARRERDRAAAVGRAGDLDAYLALQRARWHQSRRTPEHAAEARRLLREAIAIDPQYALAWGALAQATAIAAENGWTNAPRRSGFAEAFELAREAVRLDACSGESWYSLGEAHLLAEVGWDECLAAFERSLSCNPSHVAARARLATPLACTGRPAEAVRAAELALRLSPRDPRASVWLSGLSVSRYLLGEYETAVTAAHRSLALRPDWAPVHHPLAASLARLGRREEAAEAFARLLRLEPDAPARMEHFARGFRDRAAGEHLLEGLRLAAAGR